MVPKTKTKPLRIHSFVSYTIIVLVLIIKFFRNYEFSRLKAYKSFPPGIALYYSFTRQWKVQCVRGEKLENRSKNFWNFEEFRKLVSFVWLFFVYARYTLLKKATSISSSKKLNTCHTVSENNGFGVCNLLHFIELSTFYSVAFWLLWNWYSMRVLFCLLSQTLNKEERKLTKKDSRF